MPSQNSGISISVLTFIHALTCRIGDVVCRSSCSTANGWLRMSHRKSYSEVERNKKIWKKNVIDFKKSTMVRGPIPLAQIPLMDRTRMPLKKDVIGRFKHMAPDIKSRKDRLKKIFKEAKLLWTEQLTFSSVKVERWYAVSLPPDKSYALPWWTWPIPTGGI